MSMLEETLTWSYLLNPRGGERVRTSRPRRGRLTFIAGVLWVTQVSGTMAEGPNVPYKTGHHILMKMPFEPQKGWRKTSVYTVHNRGICSLIRGAKWAILHSVWTQHAGHICVVLLGAARTVEQSYKETKKCLCQGTGSAIQAHKMTWSTGVHQLCSAFISLVSLSQCFSLRLCLAHARMVSVGVWWLICCTPHCCLTIFGLPGNPYFLSLCSGEEQTLQGHYDELFFAFSLLFTIFHSRDL